MKASVLKPGLLVSLHSSLRGGVSYQRIDLETERQDEAGALVSRWETKRQIPDPEEYARATKARSAARAAVSGVCCHSAFGLLCPSEDEGKLEEAIARARTIADGFNATAQLSRVEVFVLVGRVAQDDAEAARAISSEMRELIETMQRGIRAADPEVIREAANRARQLGGMLTEESAGKVNEAIKQARDVARELVKRVGKAGENAAKVVASLNTQALETARFAFLDMSEGAVEPSVPAGRGIDLDAAPVRTASVPDPSAFRLEFSA